MQRHDPRKLLLFAWIAVQAACDTGLGTNAARTTAKTAINRTVQSRFPDVPIAPVSDCIIENASGSEIVAIARGATGSTIDDSAVALILEISTRPETVRCLIEDAGPVVAASLAGVLGQSNATRSAGGS